MDEKTKHQIEKIKILAKEIRKDVSDIKSEMVTLKIKVAGFSSFIGALASYLWSKLS